MLTGGGIGAAVNTGAQYVFNNGQISMVDTAMAGATGALTYGTGLLPGLLINTGGALAGSAMKGDNPNMSMAGAAAGTVTGYVLGGKVESALGDRMNPWYRAEWVDIGNGVSKFVPPSAISSIAGTTVGAITSESTSAGANAVPNYLPKKK
jgi:filamentous hemagglutinin